MHLLVFITVLFSFSFSAFAKFCAKPFSGVWSCDTNIFGSNIEIKIMPPGHGLANGMISVENKDSQVTELSAPLDYKWTSNKDFYPVRARCDQECGIVVEFEGREIQYRKASGSYCFTFGESNRNKVKLHIIDVVRYNDGSDYKSNATCYKK